MKRLCRDRHKQEVTRGDKGRRLGRAKRPQSVFRDFKAECFFPNRGRRWLGTFNRLLLWLHSRYVTILIRLNKMLQDFTGGVTADTTLMHSGTFFFFTVVAACSDFCESSSAAITKQ